MTSVREASIPRNNRGCLRDAAIVGSVILVLMIVVGVAASFVFFMADNTLKQEDMASLSEGAVRATLEGLDISEPDLSDFAYVSSGSLKGPTFEDIDIGSIRYGSMKDGKVTASTRMVTANAVWENAGVKATRPITAEFSFAGADEGWQLTVHTLGTTRATPLRPLNVYDLEDDIPSLLRMYDPVLGDTYADAHIQMDANLRDMGGTVKATMSKKVDGEPMECVVDLVVSWSNDQGWVVKVANVSAQASGSFAPASEQEAVSAEPVEGDGDAQALYCHEGDLVELVGTLTQKDGIFVLDTRTTTVHMSGRSWTGKRFVVTGPSAALTEKVGDVVTLRGYVTAGYVLDDAPLSLAMVSVS